MVVQEFGGYKPRINTSVNAPSKISHYWYPPQWLLEENVSLHPEQSGLVLYADMFDNRAEATGIYAIPRVEVFAIEPPAEVAPIFAAPPFEANVWRDTAKSGDVSSSINLTNGLSITFPSSSTNDFRMCFWEFVDESKPVPLETDTLYRVTFTVTSTGDKLPVFRGRVLTRYPYLGSTTVITPTVPWGSTFDYAKPGSIPREVVCYLPIEDQYLDGTDSFFQEVNDLLFSIDTYGPVIVTDPYVGSFTVSDIKVETFDLP